MSSSPSSARAAAQGPAQGLATSPLADELRPAPLRSYVAASPFPYSPVAIPGGGPGFSRNVLGAGETSEEGNSQTIGAQTADREAQVRIEGRQQGEHEARAKFEEQIARERSGVAKALDAFARERAEYYLKIETEAVQLALSIARKVLHREAQTDPLLLMGVVRVALEQMQGATEVTLAVHPQRAEEWRKYADAQMEGSTRPQVVADPALALDQCELRTSMGAARMGVEIQMKEIEQGLMDLLAARPGNK